jgi:sugar phosphate isomerase/epimerase
MPDGGRAIVGYTGFVGSNLLQFYKFDHFYNSRNFTEAANQSFDELFFCGVPAVKWRANKYPQEDADIIEQIETVLNSVTAKRVILISTIDVYDDVDREYDEDYDCDWVHNHAYGRNRYLFERFIQRRFENHHIIRLPALFGKGLKKNVIYDLIHANQLGNIPRNSMFQWYDLDDLGNDIDITVKNGIQICNLFTEPLPTCEILDLFDHNRDAYNQNKIPVVYNSKTKYSYLWSSNTDGYIRSKGAILEQLRKYLDFNRIDKSRLSVSNICIRSVSQFQFARLLCLYGIQRVQIAPTSLLENADWSKIEDIDTGVFINQGLTVHSFQSITYTLNYLNIFSDTRDQLMDHLKLVVSVASKHGASILVFGCPRNRRVLSETKDPDTIFAKFFQELGDYCTELGVVICIELNAKDYGCNYLNTIEEVGKIVSKINHPNIKMMLDIGNIIMENDDITKMREYKNLIYNIDISQPNMSDFSEPHARHGEFSECIQEISDRNRTLEMLPHPTRELESLTASLANFIKIYGLPCLKTLY